MGDHILDQFNGRITFAPVLLLAVLGCNDYILQVVHVRFEFDLYVLALLPLTQRVHLCLVTYHLEVNRRVTGRIAQREVTVKVGSGAILRVERTFAGWLDKV